MISCPLCKSNSILCRCRVANRELEAQASPQLLGGGAEGCMCNAHFKNSRATPPARHSAGGCPMMPIWVRKTAQRRRWSNISTPRCAPGPRLPRLDCAHSQGSATWHEVAPCQNGMPWRMLPRSCGLCTGANAYIPPVGSVVVVSLSLATFAGSSHRLSRSLPASAPGACSASDRQLSTKASFCV
jgi:hypothetical protein